MPTIVLKFTFLLFYDLLNASFASHVKITFFSGLPWYIFKQEILSLLIWKGNYPFK